VSSLELDAIHVTDICLNAETGYKWPNSKFNCVVTSEGHLLTAPFELACFCCFTPLTTDSVILSDIGSLTKGFLALHAMNKEIHFYVSIPFVS